MRNTLLPGLLFCSILLQAQQPFFTDRKAYPVKTKVNMFQVKDITGDGVPDITTFFTAMEGWFGILAGKPAGRFAPENLKPKPLNYFRNDIADLNKDGFPDLVMASYWENGIRVFYGNKRLNYAASTYLPLDMHGREVECIDINKDGHIDIVATTSGSGRTISLHVFINKGDGTFHPKRSFPSVLDTCRELFFTDKNKDGLMDAVVSSSFPWLVIFFQQADGSFEPRYWPTYTTARMGLADVNQDNRDDLLLLYSSFDNNAGSDSMLVLINNTDSFYAPPVRIPQFAANKIRPTQVQLADINRDGFQDMVVNQLDLDGEYDDTVFYMTGKANGVFDEPVAIPLPGNVLYTQLADINNDGFPDLVVSCDDSKIYTFFNSLGKGPVHEGEHWIVYPNPAAERIWVMGLPPGTNTLTLFNATGNLLQKTTIKENGSLPVNHLPAGIYYLQLQHKDQKSVRAFRRL